MEEKLIKYLTTFQLSDLIGFAAILQVQEEEDFNEYIVNIVEAFAVKNRKIRKELLKLAKDISLNNRDFDRGNKNGEENL
nr:MAG: hypothetical protein [Bacteriophage sp.]